MVKKYCEKYDAYFDDRTKEWLEEKCTDNKCEFCSKRPKKHNSHKWESIDRKQIICS